MEVVEYDSLFYELNSVKQPLKNRKQLKAVTFYSRPVPSGVTGAHRLGVQHQDEAVVQCFLFMNV